jgi:hypothetical protein
MITLPPLVSFNDYPAQDYIDAVYAFFKQDFLDNSVYYLEQKICCDSRFEDNKVCTFWHIVTSDLLDPSRPLDTSRSARIRWPKPIIEGFSDSSIKVWENVKKDKKGKLQKRIYFSFNDWEYLVVVEKRINKLPDNPSKYYLVIFTAFPIIEDWYKAKLEKEYNSCI